VAGVATDAPSSARRQQQQQQTNLGQVLLGSSWIRGDNYNNAEEHVLELVLCGSSSSTSSSLRGIDSDDDDGSKDPLLTWDDICLLSDLLLLRRLQRLELRGAVTFESVEAWNELVRAAEQSHSLELFRWEHVSAIVHEEDGGENDKWMAPYSSAATAVEVVAASAATCGGCRADKNVRDTTDKDPQQQTSAPRSRRRRRIRFDEIIVLDNGNGGKEHVTRQQQQRCCCREQAKLEHRLRDQLDQLHAFNAMHRVYSEMILERQATIRNPRRRYSQHLLEVVSAATEVLRQWYFQKSTSGCNDDAIRRMTMSSSLTTASRTLIGGPPSQLQPSDEARSPRRGAPCS
jgi:hypothetical protein